MEVRPSTRLEKGPFGRGIHFEPGIHPVTEKEMNSVFENFGGGNLNASIWNKEVSQRITSYSMNAPMLVFTIDGLTPQPPSSYPFIDPREATNTWISLPARPNILTSTEKVYVVKGDTDYYRLPEATVPEGKVPTHIQEQMDSLTKATIANGENIFHGSILGETAGIMGIGLMLWGASKFLPKRKISRRGLLHEALFTATAAGMAGSLLRYYLVLAARVSHEPSKAFLQVVANAVRPRIQRLPLFVDGRTALLLAKAEDAQTIWGDQTLAENVVVMGTAHFHMVETYLQDKKERNNAIATYAIELLDVAKQVYAEYYHISPKQLPSGVLHSVLNYISQGDIVQVTDPGGPSMQPNFPPAVGKQIIPVKNFNSPQVEEAIKHLRA